MISRRLTKAQKTEILEAYRAGGNSNFLAEKYSCTPATINRTVKTLLSESEYKLLKEKRSKLINKKVNIVDNQTLNEKKEDLIIELDKEFNNPIFKKISSLAIEGNDDFSEELYSENKYNKNQEFDKDNNKIDNKFAIIEPLITNFDFDKKEKDFEILHYESLPETVYMLVDKKVELEVKSISDLPEWSFLPETELKRNAILLFSNQRTAKRSCSKNQRVIKIPNTNVFDVSKSYLLLKGITRLIIDDSIIALDK